MTDEYRIARLEPETLTDQLGFERKRLFAGETPDDTELLHQLSINMNLITDFWQKHYLEEYIRESGNKIKFVAGRSGNGKSHLLKYTAMIAREKGYITAEFSVRDIWACDLKETRIQMLYQTDILNCLRRCCVQIIKSPGFTPKEIPKGLILTDYLSRNDLGDVITCKEIRPQPRSIFLESPLIDNNFALACNLSADGVLGHPSLEDQNRQVLLSWLEGDKSLELSSIRSLGLSPVRITKYNARYMLRPLAEVVHTTGYSGLFIVMDSLEILLSRSSLDPAHYIELRREDTYEGIRQLIDDIDNMKDVMSVFAFEQELLDHDSAELESHQALWVRIQNEVTGEHFNRLVDIVDLGRLVTEVYTPQILMEMSQRLAGTYARLEDTARSISLEIRKDLISRPKSGSVSLPRLMNTTTLRGEGSV